MGTDARQLVKDSYHQILKKHDKQLASRFYRRLFEAHPDLKPLFDETDMLIQMRMFHSVLSLMVDRIDAKDGLLTMLENLGQHHAAHQVPPEYFVPFGEVLLSTLADLLGDDWTPEVNQAWAAFYREMVEAMIGTGQG